MLRRHIVLLIAIHPLDGDIKPGGPRGAFQEEQAMSQHRVLPSPFLSLSSHTTQLHYTNSYTYSHPNLLSPVYYTDTRPTRNVVCQSCAWFKNRPHLMPFIRLAWNPKHVIVQWVGIETNKQTNIIFEAKTSLGATCSFSWVINKLDPSHLWNLKSWEAERYLQEPSFPKFGRNSYCFVNYSLFHVITNLVKT